MLGLREISEANFLRTINFVQLLYSYFIPITHDLYTQFFAAPIHESLSLDIGSPKGPRNAVEQPWLPLMIGLHGF
jgi:hypothetical protein